MLGLLAALAINSVAISAGTGQSDALLSLLQPSGSILEGDTYAEHDRDVRLPILNSRLNFRNVDLSDSDVQQASGEDRQQEVKEELSVIVEAFGLLILVLGFWKWRYDFRGQLAVTALWLVANFVAASIAPPGFNPFEITHHFPHAFHAVGSRRNVPMRETSRRKSAPAPLPYR